MLSGDIERGHQPEMGSYYQSTLKIRLLETQVTKVVN